MAHSTLKLRPGVNTTETPALNEAGISSSQLIRFYPDPVLGALVAKLGGWTKFFPNTISAIVRALWGWEDTEGSAHLAVGTQNIGATNSAELAVITNGNLVDITPTQSVVNAAPGLDEPRHGAPCNACLASKESLRVLAPLALFDLFTQECRHC